MEERLVVIGGGPAGISAAIAAAELGAPVTVIEKNAYLGGRPIEENYASLTPYLESAEEVMGRLIAQLTSFENVDVLTSSKVVGASRDHAPFELDVLTGSATSKVEAASVIIATGFTHFDPGRETQLYGYYEFPDVIALQDLEAMLKEGKVTRPSNGETPQRICFVQCVGSRDRQIGNEYCSKVCCGVASKEATEIKLLIPSAEVFIFYIDMRMYGYWENQIYWPAQEKHHVQYVKGIITEVLPKDGKLLVRGEDTTMGRPMEVLMDLVVLSVGMEASPGTRQMAALLGVKQNKYGFIEAANSPLDTVSTSVPGVYAVGAALGPSDLEDCASSGGLAAAKAVRDLHALA
ncbi:FAD-dependent oxidoreductase [Ferrimicrobium sp.]|uniref:FAD-dependent oxidoreductase n=1 Tax=Ferrimicrobium sp. TaxID=2926050 RepID=UPI0026023692|nr:FAD-dependent oxidoreductase [Ferrimicrobium sp.]